MKRLLFAFAAAAALSACSPAEKASEPDAAAEAVAPAAVSGPNPGAVAKRMPLPDCADTHTTDAGPDGWDHPDCRMMRHDDSGVAFEVRWTKEAESPSEEMSEVTIQVVARGDATLQTVTEEVGGTFEGPYLQDIDEDDVEELLVPLETGNVNTSWAVWRAPNAEADYARIGVLSGVDIGRTADGYIFTSARSSAASWVVSFYRLEGEGLKAVVDVEAAAAGVDETGHVTEQNSCKVVDAGGLAETGLTAAQAEAKFCGDPAVRGIFE
ncbi:MAG: hypothetical protein R3C52_13615 [Hyphomonadaceae bacterium]